jgi:pilus assembly protein FimV
MTYIKRISAACLLAAALLAFSPAAWSLGLGDVTVESFLNQPLRVRIDLISQESDDLGEVTAKLASASDYELIGASRESIPVPIRFTLEDVEGDAYILGTSKLSIGDPVVRLIVEVNWSSGRLLREYTIFLDPPTYTEPAPHPRVDERKAPPPVSEVPVDPVESPPPATTQTPLAQPPAASTKPREPVEGEFGPVKSGDTLWVIASNWSRGTGMEINKVMIAIQRENPDAFIRNNINLLKRGAILRMPQVDEIESISTASAINQVTVQTEEFRGRSSAEPAASPLTPLLAEETAPSALTAESSTEMPEVDSQDQLELVPPSEESELDSAYGFEETEDGGADASVTTLREDLARKEEDLITQQQENEYMADRIKELESQLAAAEEERVKNAELAEMEARLRDERIAEAAAAAKQDDDKAWYSRFSTWLIGLLLLVIAVVGWKIRSRLGGDQFVSDLGSDEDQLREIKDEAEEVLRVLDKSEDAEVAEDDAEASEESAEEDRTVQKFGAGSEDAEVLDEESSDPEIQLDLARAYISMGDKEAARVILDEVRNNGSEEQQEEAGKMLDLLAP